MVTPRTSDGSMSLVNCSRWKRPETELASAWARVVLPTPGTSSMSRWPRASKQTRDRRTTSVLPRSAVPRADSSSASLGRISGENPAGGAMVDSRWDITVHHTKDRRGRPGANGPERTGYRSGLQCLLHEPALRFPEPGRIRHRRGRGEVARMGAAPRGPWAGPMLRAAAGCGDSPLAAGGAPQPVVRHAGAR